ncbi:YxeA family protein [Bacillus sp. FJAT-42315]|uniref:YxeA family protein n=1 Tax=Bacillus sp. FJAT-42315 TaxID=2014077 RepID=UPI0012FE9EEA|nr:YxeA family protein [Bacillus sp. FJAT-42315]
MKVFKVLMGSLIVAAIIMISLTFFVKNELADMLNPLVPQKDVFVKVEGSGEEVDASTFEYTLKGIDEDGEETKVTFTASKQLREGAYLKVNTKRTYVKAWEEIQYNDLPADVQSKIN